MKREEVIALINHEIDRAERKFPTFPKDPLHASGVVSEEAGELAQAAVQWTYEGGSRDQCQIEAIQTAAMAIRFLVALDAMEPAPCDQVSTTRIG